MILKERGNTVQIYIVITEAIAIDVSVLKYKNELMLSRKPIARYMIVSVKKSLSFFSILYKLA
jgi:hypothetical protein